MALSYIISEIKGILVKNRDIFIPHLHSTPPLGDPRRYIAMTFGTEKLEWRGCQMEKKFDDTFTRFDTIHERDRRIDGQTPQDGIGRAMRSIERKNVDRSSLTRKVWDNRIYGVRCVTVYSHVI